MGHRSYTAEYRVNAVALVKEIGASAAARQLKIPVETLYTRISRAKNGGLLLSPKPHEPKASLNLAERIKELGRENRALRIEISQIARENQILEVLPANENAPEMVNTNVPDFYQLDDNFTIDTIIKKTLLITPKVTRTQKQYDKSTFRACNSGIFYNRVNGKPCRVKFGCLKFKESKSKNSYNLAAMRDLSARARLKIYK